MAMAASSFLGRALTLTGKRAFPCSSRSFMATTTIPSSRLRPLVTLTQLTLPSSTRDLGFKRFSTRPTTSSLNDPSPNWNNRPPKETILLDGCDFEHWLIVMEKPEGDPTRDEIIDGYIKTLAQVVGSEEEARQKIYSVSTRHYFAFGCLVSEELSYKIKELPKVRWVLPDSYLDVRNKDYGGEPFINGQAVPYDPKYHEEWVRNNARANERSRRNDRPRNTDRSRNFERRRENMQNRDGPPPPMPNRGMPNNGGMQPNPNMQPGGAPNNMGGGMPPQGAYPPNVAPNMGGAPPQNAYPPNVAPNMGGAPPQNAYNQHSAPNMGGAPPQNAYNQHNAPNMGGMPPQNSYGQQNAGGNMGGGMPMPPQRQQNAGGNMGGGMPMPPQNAYGQQSSGPYSGGMPNRDAGPPNAGYGSHMPNTGNFQNGGYQNRDAPPSPMPNRDYQNTYTPNRDMGGGSPGNAYQVRDIPGRDNQ